MNFTYLLIGRRRSMQDHYMYFSLVNLATLVFEHANTDKNSSNRSNDIENGFRELPTASTRYCVQVCMPAKFFID
jgi:hypothetical protein